MTCWSLQRSKVKGTTLKLATWRVRWRDPGGDYEGYVGGDSGGDPGGYVGGDPGGDHEGYIGVEPGGDPGGHVRGDPGKTRRPSCAKFTVPTQDTLGYSSAPTNQISARSEVSHSRSEHCTRPSPKEPQSHDTGSPFMGKPADLRAPNLRCQRRTPWATVVFNLEV